jgi:hypothetical protein
VGCAQIRGGDGFVRRPRESAIVDGSRQGSPTWSSSQRATTSAPGPS